MLLRYMHMGGRLPVYNAKGELVLLKPKLISHIVAGRNSCTIHTEDGEQYVLSKPLVYALEWLDDKKRFMRVHRSYVVNRWYVTRVTPDRHLIMEDETVIPITKKLFDAVIEFLNILPPPKEGEQVA